MLTAAEFNPTVVFYHDPCSDGFTAAWAARRYSSAIRLIPYDHDCPVPEDLGAERVVMLDCCFRRDDLLRLRGLTQDLLVLDHHKSSAEACGDLDFCHFEKDRSGAGLAWAFFFPEEPPPPLVRYVQDQDLHTRKYAETRDFIPSLYRGGLSFEWLDKVAQMTPMELGQFLREGEVLSKHFSHLMEDMVKRAYPATLFGHNILCSNAPYPFHSAVANRLAYRNPRIDFGLTFGFDRIDRIRVSLRSRSNGMFVDTIATRLGGGGHEHAGGSTLTIPKFFELILPPA